MIATATDYRTEFDVTDIKNTKIKKVLLNHDILLGFSHF